MLSRIVLSSALLIAGVGVAVAKDIQMRKNVRATGETAILPHSSFRGECETRAPEIKILDNPANGTVAIKSGPRKFPAGGKGNMAKCDGKTGVAAAVFYTPKSGFQGFDKVRYEVTFASGNKNVYIVQLRVGTPKQEGGGGWTKAQ